MRLPSARLSMPAPAPRPRILLLWPWLLLLLGAGGFAAVWILFALYSSQQHSWMAIVGAIDIAWMLRLGGWPRGGGRTLAAVLATLAMIAAANFGIAAAEVGSGFGLLPWDSATKLGWVHAWTLAQVANSTLDLVLIGLALLTAALLSR